MKNKIRESGGNRMKKRITAAALLVTITMSMTTMDVSAAQNATKLGVRGERTSVSKQKEPTVLRNTEGLKHPIIKEGELTRPVDQPRTVKEFQDVFLYMGATELYTYTIEYPNLSFEEVKVMMDKVISESYDLVFARYPEYYSFTNGLKIALYGAKGGSKLTFTLQDVKFTEEKIRAMRKESFTKAEQVIDEMIATGKITHAMSETAKAKVLFEWVVHNTEYDYSFAPTSTSVYGQMVTGKAICHGYTGSFNLLAKTLGINVAGVVGVIKDTPPGQIADHTWTVATLDGEKVYIDATWGDPKGQDIDYNYFKASEAFMRKTHSWTVE